ncbi:hypothetical protein Tco_1012481 [Tanacetum coccineum]
MAPMALSDSEVKTCSKTCLTNYETLKKQYDDLIVKLHETIFKAATYKRGLATVEEQIVTYRKNKVLFSKEVAVLQREVGIKQYEINTLKTEFEKLKKEKDAIDFKIEKFGKASKDLDQLLGSQITDNSKKGFGYSAVLPPHPLIYNRPNKVDLSYSDNSKENSAKSLVKEQVSQVKSSFIEGCESNTSKSVNEVEPKEVRKNDGAQIIEDWVSDDEEEDEPKPKASHNIMITDVVDIGMLRHMTVTAGIVSNNSANTSEENIPNDDDAQKQDEDGLNNENAEQERFSDDSSSKDVNAVRQQVNTASPNVNTGSPELNAIGPSVSTASRAPLWVCWSKQMDLKNASYMEPLRKKFYVDISVDLIGDEDSTDEDGDIGVLVSLGDEIFSEGKKSRESNIGDSDNIRNGGKTAGRAIITWSGGIASLISKSEGTIVE